MSSLQQQQLRTELIVYGYMKDVQSLFPYQLNPYYTIPDDIALLTLSYLRDYYSNDGIYKWKIEDKDMVQKMLNAKCGDRFDSDPFIMGRLLWRIEIFPNGNEEELKGYLVIYLRLLSLPSNVDKVAFHRIFRVMENMAASSWIFILTKQEYAWWRRKCPLRELIDMNCKTITVQIEITIHKIILKENVEQLFQNDVLEKVEPKYSSHSRIMYKFEGNELKLFKQSKMGKEFICGDVVDNMWFLTINPNGVSEPYIGNVGVMVYIYKFPQNIKKINIKYKFFIVETEEEFSEIIDISMARIGRGCPNMMTLKSIKDFTQLTIIADIDILSVIEHESDGQSLQICDALQITQLLSTNTK